MESITVLAYLYEETAEPRYRPYLESWAEFLMADDGLQPLMTRAVAAATQRSLDLAD